MTLLIQAIYHIEHKITYDRKSIKAYSFIDACKQIGWAANDCWFIRKEDIYVPD